MPEASTAGCCVLSRPRGREWSGFPKERRGLGKELRGSRWHVCYAARVRNLYSLNLPAGSWQVQSKESIATI